MAYHPTAIPALPVIPLPEICPECRGPLTDPTGQEFTPLFPEASSPSKVCEACSTGYWLEDIGWMAVATFTVPDSLADVGRPSPPFAAPPARADRLDDEPSVPATDEGRRARGRIGS